MYKAFVLVHSDVNILRFTSLTDRLRHRLAEGWRSSMQLLVLQRKKQCQQHAAGMTLLMFSHMALPVPRDICLVECISPLQPKLVLRL